MAPGTLVMSQPVIAASPAAVAVGVAPPSLPAPHTPGAQHPKMAQFARSSGPFGAAGPYPHSTALYRAGFSHHHVTGRTAVRVAAGPSDRGFRTPRSGTSVAAPAAFAGTTVSTATAATAAAVAAPLAISPPPAAGAAADSCGPWGAQLFCSTGLPQCDFTRVLLFHDGENVPIRHSLNVDVHQLLHLIIREAIAAVCGQAVAKTVDIGSLHHEWNFVIATSAARQPWLPNTFVRDAMIRCGANVLEAGSKVGAVDVKVKERIRSLLMHDGGHPRPDTLVILLSADSDFAAEIRDLRIKQYQVVLLHHGNSSRVVDQQASHVLNNWAELLRRACPDDEEERKFAEAAPRGSHALSAEAKVIRRPNSQSPPRSGTSTCSSSPLSLDAEALPGVMSAMQLVDDKVTSVEIPAFTLVPRFAEFVPATAAAPIAAALPATNYRQIVETVHNGRWIQRFLFSDMREAVQQVSCGRVALELRFANRATLQLNPVAGAGIVSDEVFVACYTRIRQILDKTDLQCLAVQLPFVHDRAAFIGDQILRETADAGSVFMYCANEQNTRPVQLRCPLTWTEAEVRSFLSRHFTRCPIAVFQVVMGDGLAKIILDKNHPTLVSQRKALTSMRPVYFDDGSYVAVVEHAAEDGMRVLLVYPSAQGGAARDVEHKLRAVSQRATQAARFAVM